MAVERRYLLASSLARLIQRQGEPATRLIEAYFPARSDRTQLVRVEHGRASLILRSKGPDGQVSEDVVEVPLSHAEALAEVAAGTVAFDRTTLALGGGTDAVLDRFILPQGLDLLSVTIGGDPRLFAPPLWLGPEVTGEAAFEVRELAISGLPALPEAEISNAALEALLDTLGGRSGRRAWTSRQQRASRTDEPTAALAAAEASSRGREEQSVEANPVQVTVEAGEPIAGAGENSSSPVVGTGEGVNEDAAPAGAEETSPDAARGLDQQGSATRLPDVRDGPSVDRPEPAAQRRPMLRTNVTELDEGIARLARSLAPRGPRSTH